MRLLGRILSWLPTLIVALVLIEGICAFLNWTGGFRGVPPDVRCSITPWYDASWEPCNYDGVPDCKWDPDAAEFSNEDYGTRWTFKDVGC